MPSNTANVISQSTIILTILGSTVVATVVGFVLSWMKEVFERRALQNRERQEKLYSAIKFYLMLMNSSSKTKQEILRSRHTAEKKEGYKDTTQGARMKKFTEDYRNLTTHWWDLAKKVLDRIERNSQYIRKNDWPVVEELFESHIFRKFITGEASPKDNYWMYDEDIVEKDGRNEFVAAIGKLYQKVK